MTEKEADIPDKHRSIAQGSQILKRLNRSCANARDAGPKKKSFRMSFDRAHKCGECGKDIDFAQCTLEGGV